MWKLKNYDHAFYGMKFFIGSRQLISEFFFTQTVSLKFQNNEM